MSLRYEGRYAGVFIDHEPGGGLMTVEAPIGVSGAIYRSPSLCLAVVTSPRHPDPVLAYLNRAHGGCRGASFVAGVLDTGAGELPERPVYLLRARLGEPDETLHERLRSTHALCLHVPVTTELLIICEHEIGLELCDHHPGLMVRADLGLAHLRSVRTAARPPSARPRYDPVGAQAAETIRSTSGSFAEARDDVVELLGDRLDLAAPAEVLEVSAEVEHLVGRAREHERLIGAGAGDREAFAGALDAAAAIGDEYTARLARLAESLRQHAPAPDPFGAPMRYAQLAQPLALRAMRAVLHDSVSRLAHTPDKLVVPVLAERIEVTDGLLGDVPWDRRIEAPRGCIVSFPRRLALRLGALPLLAASAVRIGGLPAALAGDLVDGERETMGREPAVRLDAAAIESGARVAAVERAETLLADLVGATIAGPAYVFALARFATGQIAGGGGAMPAVRAPGLSERLGRCLALIRRLGVDPGFTSAYVDPADEAVSDELSGLIVGLVSVPFAAADAAVLAEVCESLASGETVDVAPLIALNALWSAVATAGGYLNEVALVESIVRRCPPP